MERTEAIHIAKAVAGGKWTPDCRISLEEVKRLGLLAATTCRTKCAP
jgi:hypothetical protein